GDLRQNSEHRVHYHLSRWHGELHELPAHELWHRQRPYHRRPAGVAHRKLFAQLRADPVYLQQHGSERRLLADHHRLQPGNGTVALTTWRSERAVRDTRTTRGHADRVRGDTS